ncbi:MAG: hypothetical protein A2X25_00425 [Chloroflexi bacterium GWB2_49_20]|nr:MAG: hypothetical protein A2X25_00425 [Chloroflexi bacterium GWB2_49_20]OGN80146.1 MAG: hypothetical protein A2X26_09280 [Chloroflexi bacterium GWC2_49_37]OGN83119.1 MAG: hypothetical protein A2X27_13040 [Chloroflexi bacterium GWD2_49_16]
MQSFFENYLNNLQELHDEIRNAVKGLPQNALDWIYGPGMNSLNVLVVHLTGAERYWISDVLVGEPSGRDRESEFKIQGLSANELVQRLGENENYIHKALETFTLQELDKKIISPRDGREVAVGWVLFYVLKHTALHVGQIQLTHQLWEQRKQVVRRRYPKEKG